MVCVVASPLHNWKLVELIRDVTGLVGIGLWGQLWNCGVEEAAKVLNSMPGKASLLEHGL